MHSLRYREFTFPAGPACDAVSRLPVVLDQIDLIDLGPGTRILARTVEPVNETSNTLSVISRRTNTVTATITLGSGPEGSEVNPEGVAVNPVTGSVSRARRP